ncbi:L-threonylcarbamoyladenylate synthase [Lichenicoccus sp.]|uniref:L-threonylcarbamoyladenylate synthase n=1 Tax=Lichenicoccus sp. TaxID=2781899 RepID=UPI003D0BAA97
MLVTESLAAGPQGVARAAALLQAGRLVAFGTETVYGLGADACNREAVRALFEAKRRPGHNPLIAHVADADAAFAQGVPKGCAQLLAAAFWPGPLTLVLPRRPDSTVCAEATAGLPTIALRVPAATTALALLRAVGRPVAAPSANRSGRLSPTEAAHVLDGLAGRIDAVLDCGPCPLGLESTVLDLAGGRPRLLRAGGVPIEAIAAVLAEAGLPAPDGDVAAPGARPASPGMLASHYAPLLPLRLDAGSVASDEALLAFGAALPGAALTWNLSAAGDTGEAATRLFAGLRALDDQGIRLGLRGIAAMPVPGGGLGPAIRDRLARAAAPRDARPGQG